MTIRYTLVLAILVQATVLLVAACDKVQLPSEQDVVKVFTTTDHEAGIESHIPPEIPVLAVSELEDWGTLCDHCHVGPHYSSHTILEWGHRDSCLEEMPCHDCHSQQLHLTRVRGDKAVCFSCHVNRGVVHQCKNCHGESCAEGIVDHDTRWEQNHGEYDEWMDLDCFVCHGSQDWCMECHGVPMPHPEDNLNSHVQLVQGEPQKCMKCHGQASCDSCHREMKVVVNR